jgi:hypothetical protein
LADCVADAVPDLIIQRDQQRRRQQTSAIEAPTHAAVSPSSWKQRAGILEKIEDPRIRELGYRLIFSEKPNCLSAPKLAELDAWRRQRLRSDIEVPWLTVAAALDETEKLFSD